MLVSGIIAGAISWEAVFYIEGGVSVLWLFLWALLIADTPQTQRFISEEERNYIVTSLNQGGSEAVKHEVRKGATCRGLKFYLCPNTTFSF